MKIDIKSLDEQEITAQLQALGEPAFRGKQVFIWLHKGAASFDEMTNLSKGLREKLKEHYVITVPQVERKLVSQLDGTMKYLWRLQDGNCIETVLMKYKHGNSVCISTEVGCKMGCVFCASTQAGFVRRLMPSEILDQVLFTQLDSGEPISNIVLMGIGEPLDNYDNVLKFLALVNHPDGMHIGMRHISLSTCGLVEQIGRLAESDLQLTLSVSLHAPDDETRNKLLPINRAVGVDGLMEACRAYFKKTGRRVTFEYSLVHEVNDTDEDAKELSELLAPRNCHLNLIPVNPVKERSFQRPSRKSALNFKNKLEKSGINVTIRREMGSDIDGACGQLRRRYEEETMNEN